MRIQEVNIEDVYPVEDDMGNMFLSRDYSLPENQRYIDELAASFGANGEPNEPPVLVPDGDIFRTKAGNSRVMAMRKRGTKTFTAIIDEDDTPKSLLEAAIRTNTKKAYEPLELSRLTQQLFLFGPDEYVSEVTGLGLDDVRKARRTRENVEDAAEDLTIERMIALADFEDDADAYQRILNAKEKDWRRIADDERYKIEVREHRTALRAALGQRGIEEVDSSAGLRFQTVMYSAEDIPDDIPSGAVYIASDSDDSPIYLYAEADEEEVDQEAETRRARKAEIDALYEKVRDSRIEWLLGNLDKDLSPLCAGKDTEPYTYRVSQFLSNHDVTLPLCQADYIDGYLEHSGGIIDWPGDIDTDRCMDFCFLTDAMRECGYEPCQEELTLYQIAEETIEEAGE